MKKTLMTVGLILVVLFAFTAGVKSQTKNIYVTLELFEQADGTWMTRANLQYNKPSNIVAPDRASAITAGKAWIVTALKNKLNLSIDDVNYRIDATDYTEEPYSEVHTEF